MRQVGPSFCPFIGHVINRLTIWQLKEKKKNFLFIIEGDYFNKKVANGRSLYKMYKKKRLNAAICCSAICFITKSYFHSLE